jgi:hypothetical protein
MSDNGKALKTSGALAALDVFDGPPIERRLEFPAGHATAAAGDKALGNVTLAAAVMGGIDRQAEGRVLAGDGALDKGVDPAGVAAHIELKHAQCAGRGLSHSLQPGIAAELSMWATPNSPAALTAGAAPPGWKLSSDPIGHSTTGGRSLRPRISVETSTALTSRSTRSRNASESNAKRLRRRVISVSAPPTM